MLTTERKIKITDTERLIIKSGEDNIISIFIAEDLSGTVRILVFYDLLKKKWIGHNHYNLNMFFSLCKENNYISPKIIRILNNLESTDDIIKMKQTFTLFKRKINVTINKVMQKTKHDLNLILEPFY